MVDQLHAAVLLLLLLTEGLVGGNGCLADRPIALLRLLMTTQRQAGSQATCIAPSTPPPAAAAGVTDLPA